ncbi:MAG TPA: GNAT family N-acetyltransferase [Candidatus Polarisedimenticolaceae bacterium]|nr:GNAT family N-acetyltransferase [Candidatus Polarisedimenticolaceae bacterium]
MPTTIDAERPDTDDAKALIVELDAHLDVLYPKESRHGYSVDKLLKQNVAFFVVRHDGTPAACGGIELVGSEYGEVKRMYVRPAYRGLGLGKLVLERLGEHAVSRGIALLRLETGIHQRAAIRLYEGAGFTEIGPFPPYVPDPLSRFYEKRIDA